MPDSTVTDSRYSFDMSRNVIVRELSSRNRFETRSAYWGVSDLVPLGGAFAKRVPVMWDGEGPADAWTMTRLDLNANGIPDWWELIAKSEYSAADGFDWNSRVFYNGRWMTAREAYLHDLMKGMLPDGTIDAAFVNIADHNNNGIPDWWENLKGLDTSDALADSDNDGLANYAEYLISEGFSGFPPVNPMARFTFALSDELSATYAPNGQVVPDYFLRIGLVYLGEVFGDHDFMDDRWEDLFDPDKVSRYTFDMWRDPDEDGWSNWAECRAGTDPTKQNRAGAAGYAIVEHPIPEIKAKVVYYGSASLDAPIYVRAYHSGQVGTIPDAVWKIGTSATTEKYIGINPTNVWSYILGPGVIEPGSISLQFADAGRVSEGGGVLWYWSCNDKPIPGDQTKGKIYLRYSITGGWDDSLEIGDVDYESGVVSIDFSRTIGFILVVSEDEKTREWIVLTSAFVKLAWRSVTPRGNRMVTLHLKDPELAKVGESLGALREGKNMFEAFLDENKDGQWTAGEPYGVVKDVDVGWSGTTVEMELTDTAPQLARLNLYGYFDSGTGGGSGSGSGFAAANALTDRGANGSYYPNIAVIE